MTVGVKPDKPLVRVADVQSVETALTSRYSVRAFVPTPVPRPLIQRLLELASSAPSGTNIQPWQVYVVTGAARDRLCERVCAAHERRYQQGAQADSLTPDYVYYPTDWPAKNLARRRENGWGLYGLLGIQKGEKDKMHRQAQQNYRLFEAPVGIFVTIDRRMGQGAILESGMFLQALMTAARAHGLHSCPQAAWNDFAPLVRECIGATDEEILVCGLALGYIDASQKINAFDAGRVPLEEFVVWCED